MYAYNNNYPYHMTYWKYCLGLSPVYGVFSCKSLRKKTYFVLYVLASDRTYRKIFLAQTIHCIVRIIQYA